MVHFSFLLFILPFLVLSPFELKAKEIRVCKTCRMDHLSSAIQAAENGDVIRVEPGSYSEGVLFIDKTLKIRGEGWPVVDGRHEGHVFYVRADGVEISGLVIQNSGVSYVSDFAGIRAEVVDGCLFKNNRIEKTTYAIYLEKSKNCIIENNQIFGSAENEVSSGNGVHLFYSHQITVRKNEIKGHRDGLYFEFTEDSLVDGNYSHDNLRFGMHFMFSHRNAFDRNVFSANPTGVAIMYSRKLKIRNNIFEKSLGNSSYGFLIKEITDSIFVRNTFSENTLAIHLNGSNRNLFKNNIFILNGWAAEIYTNSYDNVFTQNNFISNNFDISTNSSRNTNRFFENYWDHYRGYDFDHDKKGDVAYKPVSIFSFWVAKFPEIAVLLNSPVIRFLETAEKFFPVLTPESLEDAEPRMQPIVITDLDGKEEMLKLIR